MGRFFCAKSNTEEPSPCVPVYVAAVVKRTSKNRFYLHEVVDSNGNIIKIDSGDGATQTSLATESGAGTPSPLSTDPIIPAVEDGVKGEFTPEDGETVGLQYILDSREKK